MVVHYRSKTRLSPDVPQCRGYTMLFATDHWTNWGVATTVRFP